MCIIGRRSPIPHFTFVRTCQERFPILSGLMLYAYPTLPSTGTVSDRLGFYGEKDWTRTSDIWTHKPAFCQLNYQLHIKGAYAGIPLPGLGQSKTVCYEIPLDSAPGGKSLSRTEVSGSSDQRANRVRQLSIFEAGNWILIKRYPHHILYCLWLIDTQYIPANSIRLTRSPLYRVSNHLERHISQHAWNLLHPLTMGSSNVSHLFLDG